MEIMDRVKSFLDKKVYRITAMSNNLAVLRPIDEDDYILEDLSDLENFYMKESVYGEGS